MPQPCTGVGDYTEGSEASPEIHSLEGRAEVWRALHTSF